MKRYIVIFLALLSTLFAQKLIQPTYIYKLSNGLATDMIVQKEKLYISTDTGKVDIFNATNHKRVQTISLSKIKDFMGDKIDSKIFAIDTMANKLLILSQDNGGYSRIHIFKNNTLNAVLTGKDKLNIIKAKFINKETILLGLISNDIISYNVKTHKRNWTRQASMSKFSSFDLNNDKSMVAVADESGDVHLLATKDGSLIQKFTGQNVDNIFSIAFQGDIILTGGQDRRAAIYNIKNKSAYYKQSHFFIYGVGLSPEGKIGAYSSDINNNITLFYTQTRENIATYKATNMIVNSIYFTTKNKFYVVSNSKDVCYYETK